MSTLIKTAKDARAAIGYRVEWFDENYSHHAGVITDAFGFDVKIDCGEWINRRKMLGLKIHRMYDKS